MPLASGTGKSTLGKEKLSCRASAHVPCKAEVEKRIRCMYICICRESSVLGMRNERERVKLQGTGTAVKNKRRMWVKRAAVCIGIFNTIGDRLLGSR